MDNTLEAVAKAIYNRYCYLQDHKGEGWTDWEDHMEWYRGEWESIAAHGLRAANGLDVDPTKD